MLPKDSPLMVTVPGAGAGGNAGAGAGAGAGARQRALAKSNSEVVAATCTSSAVEAETCSDTSISALASCLRSDAVDAAFPEASTASLPPPQAVSPSALTNATSKTEGADLAPE